MALILQAGPPGNYASARIVMRVGAITDHEEVEGDDLSVQAQAGFQDFAHEVEGDDQLRPTK